MSTSMKWKRIAPGVWHCDEWTIKRDVIEFLTWSEDRWRVYRWEAEESRYFRKLQHAKDHAAARAARYPAKGALL